MIFGKTILAVSLLAIFYGCKSTRGPANLKHDLGDPAAFGSFDYLEQSHSDYASGVRGPILAEDHPLTIYAQTVIDHLDQAARRQFTQQMDGVPLPRIAVRKTEDVGAFTADSKSVCYDAPIVISEGIADHEENRLSVVAVEAGRLSPGQRFVCKSFPVPQNRWAEFAAWYSRRFAPCGMVLKQKTPDQAPQRLVMTGPCREQDFFPKKSSTGGIVTKAAPNRILVFSGLFRALKSEDEFAAVLAHELAHFYRAHTADVRPYNYCYKVSDESHGHRPKPDPQLDDLCSRLRPRINFSVEEATKRRLGVYTIEQEADELALELLSAAGIQPSSAVDAWFSLSQEMHSKTAAPESPALGMDECLKLRASAWRDDQGRDVFIPLGDYRDLHHSWCYRIRNIDRELAVHRYNVQRQTWSSSNDWELIQRQAKQL